MITITTIVIETRRGGAKRRLSLTTAATKIKTRAKRREAAATPIRKSCSPSPLPTRCQIEAAVATPTKREEGADGIHAVPSSAAAWTVVLS
jgi:hypothetical protein